MACKCKIRTKLVGRGCSECNPEHAKEVKRDRAFDDWFEEEGFNYNLYEDFVKVWNTAVYWAKNGK